MELSGNVVVVTGGAGGLGEATVREFADAGAGVVIADLADDRGEKLADELGDRVVYHRTDVLVDDDVLGALEAARMLGPVRYLVVAHGGPGVAERIVGRGAEPASREGFEQTVALYLTGTYNVVRLVAAEISRQDPDEDGARGAVVTTASIAAFEGRIGQTAYAAAKGGVVGMTIAAARDLSAVGIRICCIAPGAFLTPALEKAGEEVVAGLATGVPFPKRLGRPGEYARLARHICENPFLNGEVIRLDGAQRFTPK